MAGTAYASFKVEPTQFNNVGRVMASPWKFNQLWPKRPLGQRSVSACRPARRRSGHRPFDDLEFPEHTTANYFLHTGSGNQGRPSMGAWIGYGLGSENQEPARLHRAERRPDSARRARQFQQRLSAGRVSGLRLPAPAIRPSPTSAGSKRRDAEQQEQARPAAQARPGSVERLGGDDEIESAIANYETAFRMQTAVPDLIDITGEIAGHPAALRPRCRFAPTQIFGRQCLIARRLIERGVRFIELTCPAVGHDRWDQHGD